MSKTCNHIYLHHMKYRSRNGKAALYWTPGLSPQAPMKALVVVVVALTLLPAVRVIITAYSDETQSYEQG